MSDTAPARSVKSVIHPSSPRDFVVSRYPTSAAVRAGSSDGGDGEAQERGPEDGGSGGTVAWLRSAAALGPSRGPQPTTRGPETPDRDGVLGDGGEPAGDGTGDGTARTPVAVVPVSDPELHHPSHRRRQQQGERSPADHTGSTPQGERSPHHQEGTTTDKTFLCPPTASPKRAVLERQVSTDSGCSGCSALKELYRENNGLRVRLRGVDTLGAVLRGTREELEAEKGKCGKLETAVANLQSRLHSIGLDTSVDLAEHEIFIPGHDRSFVNRLILENGRLQKQLKEHTSNADADAVERISELQKRLDEVTTQQQSQLDELRGKDEEIGRLETLARSSDDAKTAKIVHLQDETARLSKELRDLEAACQLLTDEAGRAWNELSEAKARLGEVTTEADILREKASSLEDQLEAQAQAAEKKMAEAKEHEDKPSVSDHLLLAEGQVEQLLQENKQLTEQLTEVIGMNTRWQRYNQQREARVAQLAKADSAQRSTVTVLERRCSSLQQAVNDLNALLMAQREEQRRGADAAVLSLEQQLQQRDDHITELADELAQLKVYLRSSKEGEKSGNNGGQRHEDKVMIQTLEAQVKIYRDDFNQERKDRERIQGNMEILRHRLTQAQRQLDQLRSREMTRQKVPTISQPTEVHRLVAKGLPVSKPGYPEGAAFAFGLYDDDDDLEVDSVVGEDTNDSTTEPLQCPGCAERFMVTEHSLFMQHVQVCLDQ